jgi:Arc/MetJ-type ribon-helix-helix transcriptional regulator
MADVISIRIPPSLRRELARLSRRRKSNVSDVAREALRRYVVIERLRELRERTVPLAQSRGILRTRTCSASFRDTGLCLGGHTAFRATRIA